MASEVLPGLLVATLASSAGILGALLLRRPVRRLFGAVAAYASWLLVPAALVALLLPQAPPIPRLELALQVLGAPGAPHLTSGAHIGPSFTWMDGLLCTWLLGLVLFALHLTWLQHAYLASLGRLVGARCVRWAERPAGCPALVGVWRPRIILPPDFRSRYTRLERVLILAHERVHLRRGDAGCNAAVALLRCVFWFNPLVHAAAVLFRMDQELACDAVVLARHRDSRRAYAGAMLKTQLAGAALPAGCHWRSAEELKERLRMIGTALPGEVRRTWGHACVALAALLVACCTWSSRLLVPSATSTRIAPIGVHTPQISVKTGSSETNVGVTGSRLELKFDADVPLEVSAEHIITATDGRKILEGHVQIKAVVTRVQRAATDGRVLTTDKRSFVMEGERAEIGPEAGGGVTVVMEKGSLRL